MQSRTDILLTLSICVLSSVICLPESAQAASTVGELTDVQAQAVLAEAKVRLAEAQAKLEGKEPVATTIGMSAMPPARDISPPEPVVRAIYGSGGRITASFLFAGGYEADAGAGQDLPGGYRVESISMDKVILSKDGKRFPVGFSNTAPSMPVLSQQVGGMPAPALPGAVPGQTYPPSIGH
ncbi:type IV pilus biogenesis protein PilP [Pseudomonas chlororaphis]|uniref:type IV pilus biogenesis protein PilP n=1 Tax=Pseudomonas chlororaphis TaxID=587753 RepID=UPI001186F1E4|nr:type IV pilus biogenesis protein PilP [Pseudomonas chlororaphis]